MIVFVPCKDEMESCIVSYSNKLGMEGGSILSTMITRYYEHCNRHHSLLGYIRASLLCNGSHKKYELLCSRQCMHTGRINDGASLT